VLKIQRSARGAITFRLSGRIELADIEELRRSFELEAAGQELALDLGDVTLVDCEALTFLSKCETDGVKLMNCPTYVRQWLKKSRGRP
jgi:hypothetical protein